MRFDIPNYNRLYMIQNELDVLRDVSHRLIPAERFQRLI